MQMLNGQPTVVHLREQRLNFRLLNLLIVHSSDCIRPVSSNSPVKPVTSPEMWCGLGPATLQPAKTKCPITAGGKVGLQYNHNAPTPDDDIIAASHRGPCLVYLSRDNGTSWFKVFQDGYNLNTQKFCVDTLIANKGYLEITLPKDIYPGNYLMRTEIIALHEANRVGGSQQYVQCTELTVSGGAKDTPTGVPFPGAYKENDPGILFDIYAKPIPPYPIPGPALYHS